jgi:CarboxypepD_reg-like domain
VSENPTYGEFNGNDIRRYLMGEMSPEEMHQLEKAALDDPFLAEAIEGYQLNPQVNINDDVLELKERISELADPGKKTANAWLRIAAMLALILGASLATWFLNKPVTEIQTLAKNEELRPLPLQNQHVDSVVANVPNLIQKQPELTVTDNRNKEVPAIAAGKDKVAKNQPERIQNDTVTITAGEIALNTTEPKKVPVPVTADIKTSREKAAPFLNQPAAEQLSEAGKAANEKTDDTRKKTAAKQAGFYTSHYFRGKVTDENNKPVPYASIRISNSGKGTYTDLDGNFSIVSSDSLLHADIISVGFNQKKTDLFAETSPVIIQLKSSSSSLGEVRVNAGHAGPMPEKAVKDNKEDQLPRIYAEPADGWALYEIYLKNNIRTPATPGKASNKGPVTVSFFTDPQSGKLYDFKIEKSLGNLYDKEAIRILKDGPLWEVYNSESRVRSSITIVF